MSASPSEAAKVVQAELKQKEKANPQLTTILETALLSKSPLVQRAIQEEQQFRQRTTDELDLLLSALRKAVNGESTSSTLEVEAVSEAAVIAKLRTDLELVKSLNDGIKAYPVGFEKAEQARYPLKFNKMELAIQGALDFLTEKGNFEDLCDGKPPEGYHYQTSAWELTVLGENPLTLYGSSKGTFFKTAALTVLLACSGKSRLCDLDLGLSGPYSSWIDNSAMVHTTSLPLGLRLSAEPYSRFSYSYGERFVYVHSGYAFGDGLSGETAYYTYGKTYSPRDCSSWLEALCGSPCIITTADQLYHYRARTGVGIVDAGWKHSTYPTLNTLFDVAHITDPQRDIQPGQIYCHRTFNLKDDPNMETSLGAGGHTGVVLGFISQGKDSQIVVQAYGRDMPKVEGFGVQHFPLFPEPWVKPDATLYNNKVMIFSTTGKVLDYAAASLASNASKAKKPDSLTSQEEEKRSKITADLK